MMTVLLGKATAANPFLVSTSSFSLATTVVTSFFISSILFSLNRKQRPLYYNAEAYVSLVSSSRSITCSKPFYQRYGSSSTTFWKLTDKKYTKNMAISSRGGGEPEVEPGVVDSGVNCSGTITTYNATELINGEDDSCTGSTNEETSNNKKQQKQKRLILIRHGTTYMNEKLAQPGTGWGDKGFVDDWSYRDTTLSDMGMWQCQNLLGKNNQLKELLYNEVELIAISPLRRTLQTFHYGIYEPHFANNKDNKEEQDANKEQPKQPSLPRVVALAEASERVYLTSDIGSCPSILKPLFPYVDFDSELPRMTSHIDEHNIMMNGSSTTKQDDEEKTSSNNKIAAWWWTPERHGVTSDDIDEWRPKASTYVNVGEPDHHFQERMRRLYQWLSSRKESTICLVAHWGVIEYLTGGHSFQNCEMRIFDFDELPIPSTEPTKLDDDDR